MNKVEAKGKRNTARVVGGVLLILFAILGAVGNLTNKPQPANSQIDAVLKEASRPLDNALTIIFMLLLICLGLSLIGTFERIIPKKKN